MIIFKGVLTIILAAVWKHGLKSSWTNVRETSRRIDPISKLLHWSKQWKKKRTNK